MGFQSFSASGAQPPEFSMTISLWCPKPIRFSTIHVVKRLDHNPSWTTQWARPLGPRLRLRASHRSVVAGSRVEGGRVAGCWGRKVGKILNLVPNPPTGIGAFCWMRSMRPCPKEHCVPPMGTTERRKTRLTVQPQAGRSRPRSETGRTNYQVVDQVVVVVVVKWGSGPSVGGDGPPEPEP